MMILRETQTIERYITGKLTTSSRLLFEANMLINPGLAARVKSQRQLYANVTLVGRQNLKKELERVHQQLFTDPARLHFRQEIFELFSKP